MKRHRARVTTEARSRRDDEQQPKQKTQYNRNPETMCPAAESIEEILCPGEMMLGQGQSYGQGQKTEKQNNGQCAVCDDGKQNVA